VALPGKQHTIGIGGVAAVLLYSLLFAETSAKTMQSAEGLVVRDMIIERSAITGGPSARCELGSVPSG
jgi:hypothetical protein